MVDYHKALMNRRWMLEQSVWLTVWEPLFTPALIKVVQSAKIDLYALVKLIKKSQTVNLNRRWEKSQSVLDVGSLSRVHLQLLHDPEQCETLLCLSIHYQANFPPRRPCQLSERFFDLIYLTKTCDYRPSDDLHEWNAQCEENSRKLSRHARRCNASNLYGHVQVEETGSWSDTGAKDENARLRWFRRPDQHGHFNSRLSLHGSQVHTGLGAAVHALWAMFHL